MFQSSTAFYLRATFLNICNLIYFQLSIALISCDKILSVVRKGVKQVTESLRETLEKQAFCLGTNKQSKKSPEKYDLITIGCKELSMFVYTCSIKSSKWEKLQGIKTDDKINFKKHIDKTSKKAGELSNVTPDTDLSKRSILLNVFAP